MSEDIWLLLLVGGYFLVMWLLWKWISHRPLLARPPAINPIVAAEIEQRELSFVTQQAVVDWLPASIRADFEEHGTAVPVPTAVRIEDLQRAVVVASRIRLSACEAGRHIEQFGKLGCVMCGEPLGF